jgi:mitogen-activated protein kinase 1/3
MGIAMATAFFTGARSSKISEVDAKKGLYEVDGMLWQVGSRYKILEFLGGGAYAQVCKAQDKRTDEFVAVKMVKDVMQSESSLKRVLREVCVMRRLSHPNILSLMDVFLNSPEDKNDRTDLYIVSQFADRSTMS